MNKNISKRFLKHLTMRIIYKVKKLSLIPADIKTSKYLNHSYKLALQERFIIKKRFKI
jgi:hypothetical protein